MESDPRPIHLYQSLSRREALSRREFLRVAASAGAVGAGVVLLGGCGSDDGRGNPTSTPGIVVDPPPETTTLRLPRETLNPDAAPFYLAEQFLPAEGFNDVQYIDLPPYGHGNDALTSGEIDIGYVVASSLTVDADAGAPLVALAGLHSSAFVVFGNEKVQSLRDLKGKRIFVLNKDPADDVYSFLVALLAYVDIDRERDVEFVELSVEDVLPAIQAGTIDVWLAVRPTATLLRNANIGHVVIDGLVDPPWSQYFAGIAAGNRDFVEQHPAATKRALRAILKATDVCARDPERAARYMVDKGFTAYPYEVALDGIPGASYAAWREFNPQDTLRFFALRLHEASLVKSTPEELIARASDWHFLDEIKRELAVPA